MTRPLSTRFRAFTVALAIGALVYSFGVCPGGCLEENHWYALAHHVLEHDDHLPPCAHEDHAEHCQCEVEANSAVLVSDRSLDLAPLVVWGLPGPLLNHGLLEPNSPSVCLHFSPRDQGPTATLRAQCQLFRC